MGTLFRVQPVPREGLPEGVHVFELFGSLFFGAVGKIEELPDQLPPGVQVFELFGSLFFGAVGKIETLAEQVPAGTRAVVLEMHRLVLLDTSGLEALEQLHCSLQRQGVALIFANVNEQPLSLMQRSGFEERLGSEFIVPTVADALGEMPQAAADT